VQDRIGNIQNALQVANALGISESGVVQQKNPQRFVEVTVILGADYKSLKIGD
jgi:LPS O-antigen subunit length determinant protein (WzzB/FepE family)